MDQIIRIRMDTSKHLQVVSQARSGDAKGVIA
jgi:hypothetical protein